MSVNHDRGIHRYRASALALAFILIFGVAGCTGTATEDPAPVSVVPAPQSLDEVRRGAQRELASGSQEASPHVTLAKVSEAEGDLAAAEQAYQRSLAIDPEQPTVHHDLAVLYFDRGDLAGAERSLRSALNLNPALHGSRLLLADVLAQAGRIEEARRHVTLVMEAEPQGIDPEMLQERLESYR